MRTFYGFARFFFAIVIVFSASLIVSRPEAHAQGVTSLGTDFWCGFMPNTFAPQCCTPQNVVLYIGSGTANDVHVDVYGGSTTGPVETYHTKMQPNTIWSVPAKSEQAWEDYDPEQAVYYGIHVYSSNPIVVYGYQYSGQNTSSTDSYLAIPTPALGNEYYSQNWADDHYVLGSGWYETNQPLAGQFMIISPYDNNVVTIGPVKTDTRADPIASTILHHQGDTWSVTLMKGQTYLVQSTGLYFGDADLTGTHITSTKPIALVSGHQLCSVPVGELPPAGNGSKDELLEMIPPLQAWGTKYYMMPTATRVVCGDLIRVVAGEDGETITLTSKTRNSQALLAHAGDFYDFDEVTEPSILASANGKKFLAEDILYSSEFDGDPNPNADPSSITLTPREQFEKKMIFEPPDRTGVSGFIHYATFLCEDDSIKHIQINGKPITFYPPAGEDVIAGTTPPMGCYRIQVPVGVPLVATCGSPFACYMYGFAQYETYGNPAGMALGVPSPDTLPPLQAKDSLCGNYQVKLYETRHIPQFSFEDTRIAEIAMITDSLDPRWPQASYNYSFAIDPAHPFTPGDSTAYYNLTVINPAQNAYAAVWTTDRAGNDTVYQYNYIAPNIQSTPSAPFTAQPVRVTLDSCQQLVFTNNESAALKITNASIVGPDSEGTFTVSPETINRTLASEDTIQLQLCFTPSDTLISNDTLLLGVGCHTFRYPLVGLGITPLIIASDLDFGNVIVGDTSCKQVQVQNVGKAPLTITKNWTLGDNVNFSFSASNVLPVTIPPGGSTTLDFCFHPQSTGPYETLQNWGTDLPAPKFSHSIKDTSQLLGYGVQAGLNWERPKQGFWTECANPVTDTVRLRNPTTGSNSTAISVDSVNITGADASEFTILANQTGNAPPWLLTPGGSMWFIIRFTPDLSKQYAARVANIVAYGASGDTKFTPSMELDGTVRHSTIRITPSLYDFGTVQPGSSISTDFEIHNDGDTALLLSSLTIDNGWSISGFTPGQQILPGDSAKVTITNSNVPLGTSFATLAAGGGDAPCTLPDSATMMVASSNFVVNGTGYDFGNVYVCQNGTATVVAQDSGSIPALLSSVRILDTLGSSGASQYTFENGSQSIKANRTMQKKDTAQFTVLFNPQIGGGPDAYILYTFVNSSTGQTFSALKHLTGTPLHYMNTLSVANSSNTPYTAYPSQTIDVPVSMNTTFDANSNIYQIRFVLRYKKDMFMPVGSGVTPDGGLTLVKTDTVTDPSDPTYVLETVTLGSTSAITQLSTIAHLQLQYVLSKDSVSTIRVLNPTYFDNKSDSACWVTPDTIPSAFAGLDRCGYLTIRNLLNGIAPSFSIQRITPNPVTGHANIEYSARLDGVPLTMEVYDALGRTQLILMQNNPVAAGSHRTYLGIAPLASGNYILRVTDGTTVQSVPFVVQR